MTTLWVTRAEFKSEYKDITGDSDDELITRLLKAAQEAIEGPGHGIGRTVLAESDTTRYLDACAPHTVNKELFVSDVGDLSSITTVTNGDATTVGSSLYTYYPRNLTTHEPTINKIVLLAASNGVDWTYTDDPANAIAITGKWGMWSTVAAIPEVFKLAVIQLVAFNMEQRSSNTFDTIAVPDAGIITIPKGWPATVEKLLGGWRRL